MFYRWRWYSVWRSKKREQDWHVVYGTGWWARFGFQGLRVLECVPLQGVCCNIEGRAPENKFYLNYGSAESSFNGVVTVTAYWLVIWMGTSTTAKCELCDAQMFHVLNANRTVFHSICGACVLTKYFKKCPESASIVRKLIAVSGSIGPCKCVL